MYVSRCHDFFNLCLRFLSFKLFSNATHQVNLHKTMLGLKKANLDYLIELKKIYQKQSACANSLWSHGEILYRSGSKNLPNVGLRGRHDLF